MKRTTSAPTMGSAAQILDPEDSSRDLDNGEEVWTANVSASGSDQVPSATVAVVTAATPESDPFDLSRLRLSQDFASAVGVKRLITTVPIRKPSKEWFVRTRPDSAYWFPTTVLELKEDQEIYLVAPALRAELEGESTFSPRLLVVSMNRQGVLFVWPLKLPKEDGRIDQWTRSAMTAATEAQTRWVRVTANMSLGAYEIGVSTGVASDPTWPDLSLQEIIKIAFRDKMISDLDHPVLKRLRGEI